LTNCFIPAIGVMPCYEPAVRRNRPRGADVLPAVYLALRARETVAGDRLVALRPDPDHPTGQALCIKGKAAPELVSHADRLLHPMKRTAPKGSADPGWQRISWEEALDTIAARLLAVLSRAGSFPEA
jgi:anaerobic selenocysteine-containing dehydrogenase